MEAQDLTVLFFATSCKSIITSKTKSKKNKTHKFVQSHVILYNIDII